MAKKVVKKTVKKTAAKKPAAKKAAPKKVQKKITAKKPVKKAAGKSTAAKKEAKPIRKAVKAVSFKKTKLRKAPTEVKVEDIVESRNKAISKIKGYGKRDLDHFRQIILEKKG